MSKPVMRLSDDIVSILPEVLTMLVKTSGNVDVKDKWELIEETLVILTDMKLSFYGTIIKE